MTTIDKNPLAQQLLSILQELEPEKGYPLSQLAEHLGSVDMKEILVAAKELQNAKQLKLFESPDMPSPLAVLVSGQMSDKISPKTSLEPQPEKPPKSIISNVSIGFSGPGIGSSSSTMNRAGRGGVTVSGIDNRVVEKEKSPNPVQITNEDSTLTLGDVTIRNILNALSVAIEHSNTVSEKEKWPLIDKIDAINNHDAIATWLNAPLTKILE